MTYFRYLFKLFGFLTALITVVGIASWYYGPVDQPGARVVGLLFGAVALGFHVWGYFYWRKEG